MSHHVKHLPVSCEPNSKLRCRSVWRFAVGIILAATAAWATSPRREFDDVRELYNEGQVTEARALARHYLTVTEGAYRNAKSDSDRYECAKRLISAALVPLSSESVFPVVGRFRNSMDLLDQLEQALKLAEGAPIPDGERESFRQLLGTPCRYWLRATIGAKSRAEQAEFFGLHTASLAAVRTTSLDAYFRIHAEPPRISETDELQIGSLVQTFVRAYVARDADAFAAVASGSTKLDRDAVSRRMAAGGLNFLAGAGRRVSKMAIRPITADYIYKEQNTFPDRVYDVYLPDVLLQLDGANGSASSGTVDRVLRVIGEGALKIGIPAEPPPVGGVQ
jgi:hypothetical protein